jgi:hypothetical protein
MAVTPSARARARARLPARKSWGSPPSGGSPPRDPLRAVDRRDPRVRVERQPRRSRPLARGSNRPTRRAEVTGPGEAYRRRASCRRSWTAEIRRMAVRAPTPGTSSASRPASFSSMAHSAATGSGATSAIWRARFLPMPPPMFKHSKRLPRASSRARSLGFASLQSGVARAVSLGCCSRMGAPRMSATPLPGTCHLASNPKGVEASVLALLSQGGARS